MDKHEQRERERGREARSGWRQAAPQHNSTRRHNSIGQRSAVALAPRCPDDVASRHDLANVSARPVGPPSLFPPVCLFTLPFIHTRASVR
mgnify:CR=1 FL=1